MAEVFCSPNCSQRANNDFTIYTIDNLTTKAIYKTSMDSTDAHYCIFLLVMKSHKKVRMERMNVGLDCSIPFAGSRRVARGSSRFKYDVTVGDKDWQKKRLRLR